MLVLTRKLHEQIVLTIPGKDGAEPIDVIVEVVEIDRNRVRLGISAPRYISVSRPRYPSDLPTQGL